MSKEHKLWEMPGQCIGHCKYTTSDAMTLSFTVAAYCLGSRLTVCGVLTVASVFAEKISKIE